MRCTWLCHFHVGLQGGCESVRRGRIVRGKVSISAHTGRKRHPTFFQQAFRDSLRYYRLPCALLFDAFVNPASQKISHCTLYKHIYVPSCGLELFCLPRRLVINTTWLYPYASATPVSYLWLTPMPIFIFEPHTIPRVTKTVGIAPEILDLFSKLAFASLRVNDP